MTPSERERQGREDLWFTSKKQERAFLGMLVGMAAVAVTLVVGLALAFT